MFIIANLSVNRGRQEAEGRKQKAASRAHKAAGGRQKAEKLHTGG
jgi:hypothetical protein